SLAIDYLMQFFSNTPTPNNLRLSYYQYYPQTPVPFFGDHPQNPISSLTHRRDRLRQSRRRQLGDARRRIGRFGFDNLDEFLCHRRIEEIVSYVSIPLAVRRAGVDPFYFRRITVSR